LQERADFDLGFLEESRLKHVADGTFLELRLDLGAVLGPDPVPPA
jgi:hypothetical protein